MSRAIVAAACVAAAVLLPLSNANAQESADDSRAAQAIKLSDEGNAFYRAHEYRKAIEKFVEAYAVDKDPNLLFNIARSYEAIGDATSATEKYEEFLAKPGGDIQARQKAETSLRQNRERKAAGTGPSAAQPAAARPGDGQAGSSPEAAAPAKDSKAIPIPVWIFAGVGVAVAVGGTIVYLAGVSDHDKVTGAAGFGDATSAVALTKPEAEDLKSSGDTKKAIGVAGWAIGGAALVTAGVLYFAIGNRSSAARGIRLVPTTTGMMFGYEGRL
jgi:tetratricopeptide (TPR) repeat protein